MNYKIITDENELQKFINWMPDLVDNEAYYVSLIARNKYIRDLGIGTFGSDKHQPARFTINNLDRLVVKLKQLECEVGSYVCKGIEIPQQALATYITVNPRCQRKASKLLLRQMTDIVCDGGVNINVHQEALTAIHKSMAYKRFVDIDFDGVYLYDTLSELVEYINPEAIKVLTTRGGFHAIIRVSDIHPEYVKTWYNKVAKMAGVDIVGDNLIPIAGTYQGGYTPTLLDVSDIL